MVWLATHAAAAAAPAPANDLFQAIRKGETDAVRGALAGGASVSAFDDLSDTPLMAAAMNADAEVLERLLTAGAGVNATNKESATALMRAATFEDKARQADRRKPPARRSWHAARGLCGCQADGIPAHGIPSQD